MKLFATIGFFLLTLMGSGFGQTNADSILLLLNQSQNDSAYVDVLNKLSVEYRLTDQVLALDYALKSEKLAETCNYNLGAAVAFQNIAIINSDKGNIELAVDNYYKANRIFENEGNKTGLAYNYDQMGLLFTQMEKYDKAFDFLTKSLELKRSINDTSGIANSYEFIGTVYGIQTKYDKALIQFYNSLRLMEAVNDKRGMANAYKNIGSIYFKIESYEQAQVNLERSRFLFDEIGDNTGIAGALIYLAEVYAHQNQTVKAVDAITRCLDINKSQGNFSGLAQAYLNLGRIKMAGGQKFEAYDHFINSLYYFEKIDDKKGTVETKLAIANYFLITNDIENAKLHLSSALGIATRNNYLKEEHDCVKMLGEIYFRRGEYYKAAEHFKLGNTLADSLFAIKMAKEIAQVKLQFELEKSLQNREMDYIKESNAQLLHLQKIKMVRNVALAAFILIFALVFVMLKKASAAKRNGLQLEEQRKKIDWQLELLMKQKEELEHANNTKDKFLSIIGHDLRNPFNAINSFVSMVAEHPEKMDDKTLLKYLFLIKEAGANAISLLDNLLEWAKAQNGQLVANKQNVALNYILRGNVLLIKEMARQKNIQLIEELDGNPTVYIDKNMINTIIRNLLSNALKFTPTGGTIWIKTTIKNNEVKTMVQDSGVGISDEQLVNLFEPGVIKKGLDGVASSGLGLILCKEFLWQHRQELRVDSKLNFGSTFWFYLPLEE